MMKKFVSLALFLCSFCVVFAQKTLNIGDFNSLKTYDRISVVLIKSNENKVVLPDSSDKIVAINKNGELKIKTNLENTMQGGDMVVKVYFKNLESIQASQGSKIVTEDIIKSNKLILVCNEGSSMNIKVSANNLVVKANSGSTLNLEGKVKNQDVLVNSGANYSTENLKSDNGQITANAGATANVYIKNNANAVARAGGKVVVWGNPKQQKQSTLAGTVTFK